MISYFDSMLRYFEFSGRSTRRQYWLFFLFATIAFGVALYADYTVDGTNFAEGEYGPFTLFAGLFHFIPGITVTVRRLHDTGHSGWWYFIPLVPVIGSIAMLVWMMWPPEQGENDFGPDPRGARAQAAWARTPRKTIPRQVRMGSSAARERVRRNDAGDIQRFI